MRQRVIVTVPDGVSCGQTIAVLAPDGSRLVKATIPAGLKSGDTFLVRLAVPIRMDVLNSQPVAPSMTEKRAQPQFAKSLDTWTTPIDQPVPGTPPPAIIIEKPVRDPTQPSFVDALDRWLTPVPDTKPMNDNNSVQEYSESSNQERDAPPPVEIKSFGKAVVIQDELSTSPVASDPVPPEPSTALPPVASGLNPAQQHDSIVPQVSGLPVNANIEPAQTEPKNTVRNNAVASNMSTVSNQKLLLVQVPPGLPAGATMQVEIPGENRTLAAIVPPGADTFHIAYTPRTSDSGYSTTSFSAPSPPLQAPSTLVPPQKSRAHSPRGQKLLLVRVPPGTSAGTTLHVSVPDEPGRILAAQVPPGNVQEFHVSYEARPKQHIIGHPNGMIPPANPYNSNLLQQQQQQPYYHQQPMMQPGYYHPNQSPPNNYWWPAAAGVVGAAGSLTTYSVEQQQQHQQYRDDENDNGHYDGGKDYELTDM